MHFETWTESRFDTQRARRMVAGGVVGAILVTASMAFIVLGSKGAAAVEEEEEGPLEVELAKEPEAAAPPPPPPPVEKPKPVAPRPRMASPLEVPKDAPAEKEPTPEQLVEEPAEEQPAPAVTSAAPPPPPAPAVVKPKPAVKKPIRLTEDMPKPEQLVMKTPEYPAAAKAAGIEGVVIVKFVIAEDGSVRDAKVLKGPPELAPACLEAVKTWRYKPVVVDGSPVAVVKIARFPFRIR